MATITITRLGVEHIVQLDDEDLEWASQYRWHITKAGYVQRNGTMTNGEKHPAALLHRELMGLQPGDKLVIDHINRDPLDNRKANLRAVSQSENTQNSRPHRDRVGSTERGVLYNAESGTWTAQHCKKGERWSVTVKTEAEAIAAVRARRLAVNGYEDGPTAPDSGEAA
jgi:hypothetical protein